MSINCTEAQKSMINLSNSNFSEPVNPQNYSNVSNFTDFSATDTNQTVNAFFSPFEAVWMPIYGYFMYFMLIITIKSLVFFKTRDLGSASVALLLLCALCAVRTDIITSPFMSTFQVLVGVGIAGLLIRIFAGKG